MNYSINHLCKQFSLSRSTLLYYDSIGLLSPSSRGFNNYRRYSSEDAKRLEQICMYRQTGISLEEIKSILDASEGKIKEILEKKLNVLNNEIKSIRKQQHLIVSILKNEELLKRLQIIEKDTLIDILRLAGMDYDDMDRLHAKLEEISPEGHRIFLEALGIDKEEVNEIREFARDINITNND